MQIEAERSKNSVDQCFRCKTRECAAARCVNSEEITYRKTTIGWNIKRRTLEDRIQLVIGNVQKEAVPIERRQATRVSYAAATKSRDDVTGRTNGIDDVCEEIKMFQTFMEHVATLLVFKTTNMFLLLTGNWDRRPQQYIHGLRTGDS